MPLRVLSSVIARSEATKQSGNFSSALADLEQVMTRHKQNKGGMVYTIPPSYMQKIFLESEP